MGTEVQEALQLEYLKLSYPSAKEGVWNTEEAVQDLKKYGAQLPTERMAAASTQGSMSCRASLGLMLTKTIYLLKDTEKLGLYIQLIKETTACLLDIYSVPNNPEFTELLHLCLFGFDSVSIFEMQMAHLFFQVCDFYKDQLFEEVLISPIIGLIVQFLGLLNSIR